MSKKIIILSTVILSVIFVSLCFSSFEFEVRLHKIKEITLIQHYKENNKNITKTTKTTTYRKKPCITFVGIKYGQYL